MKHPIILKPWGQYTDYIRERDLVLKDISVNPNSRLSYQSHRLREEHWYIVKGKGLAVIEGVEIPIKKDSYIFVKNGQKHRIINNSSKLLKIVEIQLGECSEDDIVRYEDDYGRTSKD